MSQRKRCFILAACSMAVALAIYAFTFYMYHYLGPDGFSNVYREEAYKPLVTFYFGVWGVSFQSAAVISLLIGWIFFPKEKGNE